MKKHPFELGLLLYHENRDIAGFHIMFSAECLYRPGIIFGILDIFAKNKISILHIALSKPEPDKPIDFIIFADFTNKLELVENICKNIERKPGVTEVTVINQISRGLIGCNTMFPLSFLDERCIILIKPGYKALIRSLEESYGSALPVILFQMGFEMGNEYFKRHHDYAKGDINLLLRLIQIFATQVGFGRLKIINLDIKNKEATIHIFDNFECELYTSSDKPRSHLIRGILSGWFSSLFGGKVVFHETRCVAKGDPYCEFIVK